MISSLFSALRSRRVGQYNGGVSLGKPLLDIYL